MLLAIKTPFPLFWTRKGNLRFQNHHKLAEKAIYPLSDLKRAVRPESWLWGLWKSNIYSDEIGWKGLFAHGQTSKRQSDPKVGSGASENRTYIVIKLAEKTILTMILYVSLIFPLFLAYFCRKRSKMSDFQVYLKKVPLIIF
jgi:hypothetical protein